MSSILRMRIDTTIHVRRCGACHSTANTHGTYFLARQMFCDSIPSFMAEYVSKVRGQRPSPNGAMGGCAGKEALLRRELAYSLQHLRLKRHKSHGPLTTCWLLAYLPCGSNQRIPADVEKLQWFEYAIMSSTSTTLHLR